MGHRSQLRHWVTTGLNMLGPTRAATWRVAYTRARRTTRYGRGKHGCGAPIKQSSHQVIKQSSNQVWTWCSNQARVLESELPELFVKLTKRAPPVAAVSVLNDLPPRRRRLARALAALAVPAHACTLALTLALATAACHAPLKCRCKRLLHSWPAQVGLGHVITMREGLRR